MARKLETTLWQLVKADGKSRYVKLRKADNGRCSTGVEGEHGSFYLRYTLNGKRKWESVGNDLRAAVRRAFGLASISRTSAWLYEQNAPQGGKPCGAFCDTCVAGSAGCLVLCGN